MRSISLGTSGARKPVAFVSYGGMSGGLRAVEQLRQVFAELRAMTVRDTVSFHMAHTLFDPTGEPIDPSGCNAAARTMLDDLAWWASALRAARSDRHPLRRPESGHVTDDTRELERPATADRCRSHAIEHRDEFGSIRPSY